MSNSSPEAIVVVGSVAIDSIETPTRKRADSIGGSATYFAMASSYHAPVKLVGVVGGDFPSEPREVLERHGVSLEGLQVQAQGKTFRWHGRYHDNMNRRDTIETQLNCFESFDPCLPESYRSVSNLFLANIQPSLQLSVLNQMKAKPALVGLDTMNLWIDVARRDLLEVLKKIDLLVINEEEAMQLSDEGNLVKSAALILDMGPRVVVVKRGEYGAVMFGRDIAPFAMSALLLDDVQDPTGAGDCFAGGLMGYLAAQGSLDEEHLRRGIAWGTTMASYCCEGFSYDRLIDCKRSQIEERYQKLLAQSRI